MQFALGAYLLPQEAAARASYRGVGESERWFLNTVLFKDYFISYTQQIILKLKYSFEKDI